MIIAISGKARTGKDTLANALRDDWGFTVLHWADPLYEEVSELHDYRVVVPDKGEPSVKIDGIGYDDPLLCRRVMEWWDVSNVDVSWDRQSDLSITEFKASHAMTDKDGPLLQWWGTEYRREHFGKDYWVQKLHDRLPSVFDVDGDERRIVIADTRYPNEGDAIRELDDGYVFRLLGEARENTGRSPDHPSEISMDQYKYFYSMIGNYGSLGDLRDKARIMVKLIQSERFLDEICE